MNEHSDDDRWKVLRARILGLGDSSSRKSYYPALRRQVAELQRVREQLRASNEWITGLIETLPDMVWEMDTEHRLTFVSPQVERILGYAPDELIGKTPFGTMRPDEASRVVGLVSSYMERGEPFHQIVSICLHKDGHEVTLESSGAPILGADGEVLGYRGVNRDVSDRMAAERALRFTQFAIDRVSDAAFWILPSGRLSYVNEAACRSLGYSREELLTLRVSDIDPAVRETPFEEFWQRLHQTRAAVIESTHRRKDGSTFPVEISANLVVFGGDEHVCAFARDITERREAEEQLAGARAMLEAAIEQSPAGILIADAPDVSIRVANSAALSIRGDDPGELLDISVDEHMRRWQTYHLDGTPYDPRDLPLSRAVLDGTVVRDEEVIIRGVDGRDRYVLANAAPVRGAGGEIVSGVVVFLDITEHRSLEARLAMAQKLEAVGGLAGGIAHDLNNLLSPILGYAELLLGDLQENDDRRVSAEEIHKAAILSRDLVRQLLAFARRQALEVGAAELNEILRDFEPLLRRTIREDISIKMRLTDEPLPIRVDVGQIEQVLLNLAINAQDAMPSGGGLTIETAVVELDETYARQKQGVNPGRYVALAVSDTGHGMDEVTRERIFDPFFTTKERGRGTGLGLATVYGIMKQHGGNIWVYSEPKKGTTFKCYLPYFAGSISDVDMATGVGPETKGQETIAIVEDDQHVRQLSTEILSRLGYKVITAADGAECLRAFDAHDGKIDLLLTDVIMPDMNGRQLYEAVKRSAPETKVLYMSGYTDNVIAQHGVLDAGVAFIQKPFTVAAFAQKVRDVLDS